MYPDLINLGPVTVHAYGVFYALGILSAVTLAEHLYHRAGGEAGTILEAAFPTVIGIILGARALFVLVEHDYYVRHPVEILTIWQGGLVFYGGLAGGVVAFLMIVHRKQLRLWTLADAAAPAIALGHSVGRLGCFLAGSCYGKPTDVPWAVVFTDPKSLASSVLGVPVHPTQLYSSAFLFALSMVLILLRSRAVFPGQVFVTYAILYGTFRFFIEFYRGDPRGEVKLLGMNLSTSQWISLIIIPIVLIIYLCLSRKRETNHWAGEILVQNQPVTSAQPGL